MSADNVPTDQYAIGSFTSIGHKLYLDDDFADFHFIFESKSGGGQIQRIPVHKIVLRNVSDVFRVMFNGSWKEKVDVEIVDASAEAFKEFLQFFYLSEAKVTSENVAEVMNLGKKYDVAECFDVCGQFLKTHITDDDFYVIYGLASHLEHEELEKKCVEYIKDNAKAILTSENFLSFDLKDVQKILQMETLYCSEVEVFDSIMKWMKAKIEPAELTQQIVQERFSGLLHEIRFRSMSMDEILSLDPSYGALITPDERREIVKMINSEQSQPKIFKANRRNIFRSIEWNEKAVVECDRNGGWTSTPYSINNIETTTFTVDKPLALGAFTCTHFNRDDNINIRRFPKAKPRGTITIFELPGPANSNRKRAFYKEEQMFEKQGRTLVTLPKAIVIRPGLKYEIRIEIQRPSNEILCTRTFYKREVHMKPGITVKFYNEPIIGDDARGLIGSLEFNRI